MVFALKFQQRTRLRDLSIVVAAWPAYAEDNVPSVPCSSAGSHLLLLSAGASQAWYRSSVIFIMSYPTDVKNVLPRTTASEPLCAHALSLWCIFDDRFVIPAYIYDSQYVNDRTSLLDCPLSLFAQDQLWRYNKTLPAYSASMTDRDHNALKPYFLPWNASQQVLTLCTSALCNRAAGLMQSIVYYPSKTPAFFFTHFH